MAAWLKLCVIYSLDKTELVVGERSCFKAQYPYIIASVYGYIIAVDVND